VLRPLEVEIRAVQEEVRALRAAREVAVGQASDTARYHQGQARFRAVFEHSPLGHKIIGPDLAIRQANAATAALLGVAAPRDLVGRRISEFAHPAHRADWAALQTALWDHHLPAFAL
jgi:two-component system sensor histidine kinase VicK